MIWWLGGVPASGMGLVVGSGKYFQGVHGVAWNCVYRFDRTLYLFSSVILDDLCL